MPFVLVVVLEVLAATLLTSLPHPKINNNRVLGEFINQEALPSTPDSAPADPSPVETTPTDQPLDSSPTLTPEPQTSPTPSSDVVPSAQDTFAASPIDQYPQELSSQQVSTEPSPQTLNEQNNTASQESTTPENPQDTLANPVDFTPNQTTALLAPEDILSNPEVVNEVQQEKVKNEEDKISQESSPSGKVQLLLNFAQDKVTDLNQSLLTDDFATANFAALRLNDQVRQAAENVNVAQQAQDLKIQLKTFCKKADFTLRSTELIVPQDSEQDLEIARGTCLSLQL